MSNPRIIIDAIDFDGCVANPYYFHSLMWLFLQAGPLVEYCQPDDRVELVNRIRSILKAAIQAPPQIDGRQVTGEFMARVHDRLQKMREKMIDKTIDRGLDANDPEILRAIDIELHHLTDEQAMRQLMRHYVELFNDLDLTLLPLVAELANQKLLARMESHSAPGDHYFVAVGSLRQDRAHDEAGININGSNSVFKDLPHLMHVVRRTKHRLGVKVAMYPTTVTDIEHSLPRGENLRHLMTKLNGDSHEYTVDTSKVLILYVLAHDAATQYPDHEIVLNFIDNELTLLSNLIKFFKFYHELLPAKLKLNLIAYDGEFGVTEGIYGSGHIDYNYRTNTNHLCQIARQNSMRDLNRGCVNVVEHADMERFRATRSTYCANEKSLAVLLDADGCIYNPDYFLRLNELFREYGADIKKVALMEPVDLDVKQALTARLMHHVKNFFEQVPVVNGKATRWYAGLTASDADIIAALLPDSMLSVKPEAAIRCQFIRYLYLVSPRVVGEIIFLANRQLFNRIVADAEKTACQSVQVFCASARQCERDERNNAYINGTGIFSKELATLIMHLNQRYTKKGVTFVHDPLLMADFYNHYLPGSSYSSMQERGSRDGAARAWIFDFTKCTLIYAFMHHIKHYYPSVNAVQFYDDTNSILTTLNATFGNKHPALLPAGLPLLLIPYAGKCYSEAFTRVVTGTGKVDTALHDSLHYMAELCKLDATKVNDEFLKANVAEVANFDAFLARRESKRRPAQRHYEHATSFPEVVISPRQTLSLFCAAEEEAIETDVPYNKFC